MKFVPKITAEYLDKALNAVVMHPDGKYAIVDVFNKAQELLKQATQDQYISADEARALGAVKRYFNPSQPKM